jgi:hypothetical protein
MRSSSSPMLATAGTFLAQIACAIVGGLALAAIFGYGLGFAMQGSELGMGVLVLMVYAGILGFGIGAGAGVALGGQLLGRRGSRWLAMLGGVLGGSLVAVLARVTPLRIGLFETLFLAMAVAVVGALGGYYLRGRA